ncbi:hypothetical protein CONLIGDRAFT_12500 [Coniochaeta ligniaria NRRL 30616]|uniref:Uncharacterized protein n=1 Tax=Coniochaeta ligniaria NRRL 30616 TaxID=1408157 RepID=A0A1J7J5D9_9PEZI|nr:hypothetical protein CONLIGDRAFT_12500 [Coniochaeta ligniaria NRRL 30616]
MTTMQTVPRFLLPRLSWKAPPTTSSLVARAPATQIQARKGQQWQSQQSSTRPLHTGPARKQYWEPRRLRSSASSHIRNAELRRAFHASAPRRRDHHFDTLKFVQRLQEDGFTEDQSVAMMKVLNDVIEER